MIPRERAIQTFQSDHFDLIVIGGGITGAGVALDAASRGYSVALVEKADFALGRELGWDSRRVSAELERFAQDAAAEGICAE